MRDPRPSARFVCLLPIVLCALGGHFVLYGSLVPSDGSHGYFRWYEPLVAALSLASLVLLGGIVLASLIGGERARSAVSRVTPPGPARPRTERTVRLALASATFLALQESVERTSTAGHLSPAAFSPGQVLLLILSLGLLASVVARVEEWCRHLVEFAVGRARPRLSRQREPDVDRPHLTPARLARRNPLADARGLRAPPLPA